MSGSKRNSERLVEPADHPTQSPQCPKIYGIVELEIEVTELLENMSTALCCLQALDSLTATSSELRIFEKDIGILMSAVTNLKHKIQKTFKDITFEEDIFYTSGEGARLWSSREIFDEPLHNCRGSREVDDTQSESAGLFRRLTAGASIITSGNQEPSLVIKSQKKVESQKNRQNPGGTHPKVKQISEGAGQKYAELEQFVNPSSFDFSNNSEVPMIFNSWKGRNMEGSEVLKLQESRKPEIFRELSAISKTAAISKQAACEQFPVKRHLAEIRKIVENLDEIRDLVPRPTALVHRSARMKERAKSQKRSSLQLRDEPVLMEMRNHKHEAD